MPDINLKEIENKLIQENKQHNLEDHVTNRSFFFENLSLNKMKTSKEYLANFLHSKFQNNKNDQLICNILNPQMDYKMQEVMKENPMENDIEEKKVVSILQPELGHTTRQSYKLYGQFTGQDPIMVKYDKQNT